MASVVALVLASVCAWLFTLEQPEHAKALTWSGYTWDVRSDTGQPGPCSFSPNNVTVDAQGSLHVKITKSGSAWHCSEIDSQMYTGYGTYTFNVVSNLHNLDPSVVLGLFTYDSTESSPGNSEMDIEASQWGDPNYPYDIEYSIQPTDPDLAHRNKKLPIGGPPYVARFVWAPTSVTFSVTDATGDSHTFVGTNLPAPPAKATQACINLWLNDGRAPTDGQPKEIVLSSFNYTPAGGPPPPPPPSPAPPRHHPHPRA